MGSLVHLSHAAPSKSTPPQPDPTAAYLEELSTTLMHAHNTILTPSSRALIRKHLSPDFQMTNTSIHECPMPAAWSLERHIANTTAFMQEHPSFVVRVENVTAAVDDGGKHAIVWLTEPGCNAEDERLFNRESVSLMYWRWLASEERWVWYKHVGIRGGGELFR